MILLLDAGNTRLKWACLIGGVLQAGEALTRTGDTAEDVRALSLAWAPLPAPARIVAVSVLGHDFICALSARTMEAWSVPAEDIPARREACGVINGYAVPERLGADRWVALIAARQVTGGAACVVDCGTAITMDALRADGTHLGGLIMPGLGLMRRALVTGTQGVRVEGDDPNADETMMPYADDTRAALHGGTLCATVAGIDRTVATLRASLGPGLRCLVTGGDAPRLLPLLAGPCEHRPELVLEGLAALAGGEEAAA